MSIRSIRFENADKSEIVTVSSSFKLHFSKDSTAITDAGISNVKASFIGSSLIITSPLTEASTVYKSPILLKHCIAALTDTGGYYNNYLTTINGVTPTTDGNIFLRGSECTSWMYGSREWYRAKASTTVWKAPDATHVMPSSWDAGSGHWCSTIPTVSTSTALVYLKGTLQTLALDQLFYIDVNGILWYHNKSRSVPSGIVDVSIKVSGHAKGLLYMTDMCVPCPGCGYLVNIRKWMEYYRVIFNTLKDVNMYTGVTNSSRHTWLNGLRSSVPKGCIPDIDSQLGSASGGEFTDKDYTLKAVASLLYEYAATVQMWNYAAATNRNVTEIITAPEENTGFVVRTKFSVPDCKATKVVCTIEVSANAVQGLPPDATELTERSTCLSMKVFPGEMLNKPFDSTTNNTSGITTYNTVEGALTEYTTGGGLRSLHKLCTYTKNGGTNGSIKAGTHEVQAKFLPFIAMKLQLKESESGAEKLYSYSEILTKAFADTALGTKSENYNPTPVYAVYDITASGDGDDAYNNDRKAPTVSTSQRDGSSYNKFTVQVIWKMYKASTEVYSKTSTYTYQTVCCRWYSSDALAGIFTTLTWNND